MITINPVCACVRTSAKDNDFQRLSKRCVCLQILFHLRGSRSWSVRSNIILGQFGFARYWLLINTLMYAEWETGSVCTWVGVRGSLSLSVSLCVCLSLSLFHDFELLKSYVQFDVWLCFNVQDQTTPLISRWDKYSIMLLMNNKSDKYQSLHDGATYWALPVYITFTDLHHISKSQQCPTVSTEKSLWSYLIKLKLCRIVK